MGIHHDLVTIAEAAAHLRLNEITIRRWLKAGKIQCFRLGPRSIRISASDLERYLEQKKH